MTERLVRSRSPPRWRCGAHYAYLHRRRAHHSVRCASKGFVAVWLLVAGCFPQRVPGQDQGYPSKPIRLITGGAPGSITDSLARPLAEKLSASLHQPVIVENRPGAGGILAMDL